MAKEDIPRNVPSPSQTTNGKNQKEKERQKHQLTCSEEAETLQDPNDLEFIFFS